MSHPAEVRRSMRALLALWEELRARPGPLHVEVRGASMWPAAPEGSVLAISPCAAGALRRGELVTFRCGEAVITHRVIEVNAAGRVIAWGDALLAPDPPIAPEDVLGRATVLRRGPVVLPAGSAGRASMRTGWVAAQRLGATVLRLAGRARARRGAA